jgi:predicted dehydrogenase
MVYIASNHSTHAPYAIAALTAGKHVYIEKPHVVTDEQLYELAKTASDTNGRLYLGFNRPGSRFGRLILQYLSEQDGAGMYNWFVAGHAIDPDHWYFQPREGGRILGNLCHWTDFVLRLAGSDPFPVEIRPTRASKSDSDIAVTYTFRDGTIAVITFSAKGHTFEGVSESFHGHRGQCLLSMHDYRELTVEIVEHKTIFRNLFRDHGHARNIRSAYRSVHESLPYDRAAELHYIYDTAWLFLNTKRALEENRTIVLKPFASYRHASSTESAS